MAELATAILVKHQEIHLEVSEAGGIVGKIETRLRERPESDKQSTDVQLRWRSEGSGRQLRIHVHTAGQEDHIADKRTTVTSVAAVALQMKA